ncbi:MAG: helix-turn-helix domain-containing protein [Methylophilaceae bacterium]|uniref:helix-turn-helix domain-containing protein n=1 Tax=Methylovorus sp. MM2 TaxID=1848038 RepID=UPI0007E1E829|nr:helix-turn-helix domain-containing protein [Methylovorus sp. MM2]OAM52647.1 AraC family transcriptional regulator [Methylovorus sp. MM2]
MIAAPLLKPEMRYLPGSLRHEQTHDFEQQAALLSGWNQDYLQISAGNFKGYISQIHLQDVHIFLEYTGQSLYQRGETSENVVAIGLPLTHQQGMFCGSHCQRNGLHLYSGSNGFEFISAQKMLVGVISVQLDSLLARLSPEHARLVRERTEKAQILNVSSQTWDMLCHFLFAVFDLLKHKPELLQRDEFARVLREAALAVVADSLTDEMGMESLPLRSKTWGTIADVRDLVMHPSDAPLSVAELCKQLGMSRRNLQYHFEQAMDISPIAFLRAERLNGVRRMLKTANSVTEAATYWGFWHFGHFSQEYKKMFGELPSCTFRRMHGESDHLDLLTHS